jgi:hypothetical protein
MTSKERPVSQEIRDRIIALQVVAEDAWRAILAASPDIFGNPIDAIVEAPDAQTERAARAALDNLLKEYPVARSVWETGQAADAARAVLEEQLEPRAECKPDYSRWSAEDRAVFDRLDRKARGDV